MVDFWKQLHGIDVIYELKKDSYRENIVGIVFERVLVFTQSNICMVTLCKDGSCHSYNKTKKVSYIANFRAL